MKMSGRMTAIKFSSRDFKIGNEEKFFVKIGNMYVGNSFQILNKIL